MKRIGLLISCLAMLVFVLPPLTADDEKKDAPKADKKEPEKKDEKKEPEKKADKKDAEKDEKKDPEKKDDEKKAPEPKKAPEKLVHGARIITKIMSAAAGSNSEITVELKEPDPKKVYDNQVWAAQQQFQLQRQAAGVAQQRNPQQRAVQSLQYQQAMANFQIQMAQRQQNIYNTKPWDVRAAENVKVRAMTPPVEFDDQGFEKKWTKKELAKRKDKTGLPGFPVDLDALRPGQIVELYMVKQAPQKKEAPRKKKNPDDDVPAAAERPEFIMIVILREAVQGK